MKRALAEVLPLLAAAVMIALPVLFLFLTDGGR